MLKMTNNQLIIGLTGGIASGKSQVSHCFSKLNIEVIDSDKIAKDLFKANSPHLTTLRTKFGDDIFNSDRELNRKALGKIVFSDDKALSWLNSFTHPLVNSQTKAQLAKSESPYVILDIPLLINVNGKIPGYLESLIDRILVVNTDLNIQLKRILKRDAISEEEALNIINAQSSIAQKLALADDVIDNNGCIKQLAEQVGKLHEKYLSLCKVPF